MPGTHRRISTEGHPLALLFASNCAQHSRMLNGLALKGQEGERTKIACLTPRVLRSRASPGRYPI
jgi:hypothetical protein